jgi:hypothetical protein
MYPTVFLILYEYLCSFIADNLIVIRTALETTDITCLCFTQPALRTRDYNSKSSKRFDSLRLPLSRSRPSDLFQFGFNSQTTESVKWKMKRPTDESRTCTLLQLAGLINLLQDWQEF